MTSASAPGKVILFGEHSVVYGQPAIAVPVSQVRATATISAEFPHPTLHLPNLDQQHTLTPNRSASDIDIPLAEAVRQVQTYLGLETLPALTLRLDSHIPIASGMGSGAAAAAAIIRALLQHFGAVISAELIANLTYNVEKLFHGTPSGIDNTVVAYEQPVYFVRQQPNNLIETVTIQTPIELLIADTGVRSSTKLAVADVRQGWQAEPSKFNRLFAACGQTADRARSALETGNLAQLGALMWQTHALLQTMTVSSAELDTLVEAARGAGALGAKLSGAGRGGNMICLISAETRDQVSNALHAAGAKSVIYSQIAQTD
ncbi:MAG: mevalonate kinase [Candidatus Promineifilaceae bacterium]